MCIRDRTKRQVTKKDEDLYSMFEACLEMYARGYRFSNIDIDKSLATEFRVLPDDLKTIIPPFTTCLLYTSSANWLTRCWKRRSPTANLCMTKGWKYPG